LISLDCDTPSQALEITITYWLSDFSGKKSKRERRSQREQANERVTADCGGRLVIPDDAKPARSDYRRPGKHSTTRKAGEAASSLRTAF
jgi:hypothetical protein